MKNSRRLLLLVILIFQFCMATTEDDLIHASARGVTATAQEDCITSASSTDLPIRSLKASPSTVNSSPIPNYKEQFLEAIGTNDDSCLPDKTRDDVGIYVYDLKTDQELVSINPDTPFQYASAFKGPLLVYFLESCPQYWDVSSPEWEVFFLDQEAARNINWYTSPEYREMVVAQLLDVRKWNNIETFFTENRVNDDQVLNGPIDQRYFILNKVYGMVTHSSNPAAADVLQFVYNNCLTPPPVIEDECGGSNALTTFNAWFTDFAGIEYENDEDRRGLYSWDSVVDKNQNGKTVETILSTYGLRDKCADQEAYVDCSEEIRGRVSNVMTARDYFQFYYNLYHLENPQIRNTAFNILRVDLDSPSKGNFKNLARVMQAESISKNGYAYYSYGPIIAETGIVNYKDTALVVVTLSYNASETITTLFGGYDVNGEPLGEPGLLQFLIEQQNGNP